MKNKIVKGLCLSLVISSLVVTAGCDMPFISSGTEDDTDPLLAVYDNTQIDEDINVNSDADADGETLVGNGTSTGSNTLKEFSTEGLVCGEFYVRHINNECEPLYLGETSFEGAAEIPSSDRVVWFKDDINQVPTLYEGESLIYYDDLEFEEKFTLERFEDYGKSIGVRGCVVTETGRIKLSLVPDDLTTYPMSDADQLLTLSNENVILESIGDTKKLRENPEADLEDEQCDNLTRSGTIKGLKADSLYEFIVYDGTFKNKFKLKADVIIMGSMETQNLIDYDFETKDVIHINIPENYHSGYYMINGLGLFRYVTNADRELEYSDINFNISNAVLNPDDESSIEYTSYPLNSVETINDTKKSKYNTDVDIASNADLNSGVVTRASAGTNTSTNKDVKSKFDVNIPGYVTIHINYTIPSSYGEGDGLEEIKAKITTPNGSNYIMATTADGGSQLTFNASETGTYIITYENLDIRVPHVTISQ